MSLSLTTEVRGYFSTSQTGTTPTQINFLLYSQGKLYSLINFPSFQTFATSSCQVLELYSPAGCNLSPHSCRPSVQSCSPWAKKAWLLPLLGVTLSFQGAGAHELDTQEHCREDFMLSSLWTLLRSPDICVHGPQGVRTVHLLNESGTDHPHGRLGMLKLVFSSAYDSNSAKTLEKKIRSH